MANSTKPLTNTEVDKAKAKTKEYNLSDGKGLSLRVKPNGSKNWIFNYLNPITQKRTNMGFGQYPDVSLAQAREKRTEARGILAQGFDPKAYKDQEANRIQELNSQTVERVTSRWFEIKQTQTTKAYAEDIWGSLNNHIFPKLGATPLHQIKAKDVIEALEPLASQGKLETVKRICQRFNEVMTYAVNLGMLEHNPTIGIRAAFKPPEKKHMPAIKPEELPELMQTISMASIKIVTRCLLEWQLHTMSRPSEAAGARWDEINLEDKTWVIPPERMKKRKEHIVPLTEQTLAILEYLKPISGNRDYLFPADRNPKSHTSEQTANRALERMGYKGRLVAHGFRSIASSALNQHGFDPDVIEAALAHVDKNEVRRAYNRTDYLERRRVLMAWWSEYIVNASTGHFTQGVARKALRAVNG
ncbi:integrase domain-containing protein [Catenovulum sp. 2E275]|uniref:integrase domain-containing protein n=1 Tax=Catenovulum sp. 2E275 TaxID=2980497 RepID=UPI0021D1AE34|nr:integrase domain-containing protein [Catenovulum sp. 2E275]MCU4674288.1 integrase domain-containing protein [Catenovulum sp. 2E275]